MEAHARQPREHCRSLPSAQQDTMRSQLVNLTLILLATSAGFINIIGCTKPETSVNIDVVGEIIQDLDLPDRGTEVVQMFNEKGRDVAIVLTKSNGEYTLWCVYRSRNEREQHKDTWKLWINYAIIEDGTGAEEPAKRVYAAIPDTDAIATFRSDILNHWSNR